MEQKTKSPAYQKYSKDKSTKQRTTRLSSKYLTVIFALLSAGIFVWFTWQIFPAVREYYDFPYRRFLLFGSLIYVLTPFSYNVANSKNKGISVRGVGLFLGQLYFYFTVLYALTGTSIYLIVLLFVAWLIYLSSIFGMQVILFSAPLLALFYWDIFFIFIPLLALAIFFAIMPRIAKNYFKGRLMHMGFYAKIVAKGIQFADRKSIWRDWIWDFWKIILDKLQQRNQDTRGLMYIYNNALVSLIFGFPFFIPLIIKTLDSLHIGSFTFFNNLDFTTF